jgi:outer membrane protein assembly factor BamB
MRVASATLLLSAVWLFAVPVARAAPAAASSPPADAPPGAATTYQVNANHDGLAVDGPSAPLRKAWSKDLGGTVGYPLVVGNRVFAISSPSDGSGVLIRALDATNGSVIWGPRVIGNLQLVPGLAADSANVYVVNNAGTLVALDQATGNQVWSVQLPGQYSFTSPPTVSGGVVYVGGAGSGGTLYAVAAETGAVLWTAPVMNGDNSSPAVTDGGVYVSYACGRAYRFATATGSLEWARITGCEGGGGSTPVLHDGKVYVRDHFYPAVLDAETGAVLDATGAFASSAAPAFGGHVGYFLQGSTLRAVDTTTSQILWSQPADGDLSTAPIVLGSQIAIGSTTGNFYLLDALTGAVRWSGDAGSPILAPDEQNPGPLVGLAASGGRLFVPATNTLVAYEGLAAGFVGALYRDFLGRDADSGGLAYWTALVESDGSTIAQVAHAIGNSSEAIRHFVTEQYQQILGRAPDQGGLAHWVAVASQPGDIVDPAADLYGSAEFFQQAGGTNSAWVASLYSHMLERSASPGELSYWSGQAEQRGRTWVAAAVFSSTESADDQISALYQTLLGRPADSSGRAYFLDQFGALGPRGVAVTIASSEEYATRS